MKEMKYCILDNVLFWKYHGGILLNCLLKDESDKVMQEIVEDTYTRKQLLKKI